jgi:hypothetical protein
MSNRVCFITAIYGNYEVTCKKFARQTIPTDFICFTDNPNIVANGWIIDSTPYHRLIPSPIDNGKYINSLSNNTHTFNIAKYYKQAFQNIPMLKKYDVVIWLDGTVEIIDNKCSEWILNNINKHKVIGWNHEHRYGSLKGEVDASNFSRYTSTRWNNQPQPYQDIFKQYEAYLNDGYTDVGLWVTCFIAFDNKNHDVTNFLNTWYLQTLQHTTQDQIGFPYTCYKHKILPYTLPDSVISGDRPHSSTQFYIKHCHGV